MSDKIDIFTHHHIWKIINTYTFTAGSSDKKQHWFKYLSFQIDGKVKNGEKTVGLRQWKFGKDRINFYDKTGKLSQYTLFSSVKMTNDGVELRLNFPNQPLSNYNLLFSDGLNADLNELPSVFEHDKEGHLTYHNKSNTINFPYFYESGKIKIEPEKKYLLSIDIRVEDVFTFIGNDDFFIISELIKDHEKDLLENHSEQLSINFENVTSKKWKHIEKEFSFDCDYIIFGPYLRGKGVVEFKNINLIEVQDIVKN